MKNSKMVLGFIAGASIGAIIGILLAPDTGEATRKKIADKSGEWKDAVKDSVTGWLNKMQKGVDEEVKRDAGSAVPKMNTDML